MQVYRGLVKGRVIVLPEGVQLEEGTEVEVRLIPVNGAESETPKEMQATEAEREEAFKQKLVEMGLLRQIKRPPRVEPPGDRTPAKIEGKPLSQIVIEDRR